MKQLTTELAWAAGFFEGEGCVSSQIKPKGWLQIQLHVVQCGNEAPFLLERFKLAVEGIGSVCGPYKDVKYKPWIKNKLPKDRYVWNLYSQDKVDYVLALLEPMLGEHSAKLKRFKELKIEQPKYPPRTQRY